MLDGVDGKSANVGKFTAEVFKVDAAAGKVVVTEKVNHSVAPLNRGQ